MTKEERSEKNTYHNQKQMKEHNYYVYILTNFSKTVLYTGVTNDLQWRLTEHAGGMSEFTAKYHCFYLVYWEHHPYVNNAIAQEKEIKGWRWAKKEALVNDFNSEWKFWNEEIQG